MKKRYNISSSEHQRKKTFVKTGLGDGKSLRVPPSVVLAVGRKACVVGGKLEMSMFLAKGTFKLVEVCQR